MTYVQYFQFFNVMYNNNSANRLVFLCKLFDSFNS